MNLIELLRQRSSAHAFAESAISDAELRRHRRNNHAQPQRAITLPPHSAAHAPGVTPSRQPDLRRETASENS